MSGDIIGIAVLLLGSIWFAYNSRIPIMFLFSGLIAFASSLYMFNLVGKTQCACEMFAIIFILVGIWQIVEFGRNVLE